MVRKALILLGLASILLLSNNTEAGTLDRGVKISPMFIAGGSANGDSLTAQLKYQMAIDSWIGIRNRYTTIYTTTVYHNDSYDSHDTVVSIDAEIGSGEISLNTNPTIFNGSSSQTIITVGADIGEGQITLNTGNTS